MQAWVTFSHGRGLPTRVETPEDRALARRPLTYAELVAAMFDMNRQSAGGVPSVLLHLMDVLGRVTLIEGDVGRRSTLRNLAGALKAEGELKFGNPYDREALAVSYGRFLASAS